MGGNLNGPVIVRVPRWLPRALGRYYMYLARHQGTYIRLAYADRREESRTAHAPGALHLDDTSNQWAYRRLTYSRRTYADPYRDPCFFEEDGQACLSIRCGASRLSILISRNV